MRVYRASPLYPSWGPRLARWLSILPGGHASGLVVADLEGFRMELDLGQVVDSQIYYTGVFEPRTVASINSLVDPGDSVIDVGANVGFMTLLLASRVGPRGRVVAFEPTDGAWARLRRNLALNEFPQVKAEKLAVGDADGVVARAKIQSSYRVDGKDVVAEQEFDVVTLDAYVARAAMDRLDFVKIDVDGMEPHVLRGGRETLRLLRPALLFEIAPDWLRDVGETIGSVLGPLRALDYAFLEEGTLRPISDVEGCVARIPRHGSLNLVAVPRERAEALASRTGAA
jgi:FkbM family methyltransferase